MDSGVVFKRDTTDANDVYFDPELWHKNRRDIKKPHGPVAINEREYIFEDRM